MRFDAQTGDIYVPLSGSVAVVDAQTRQVVANVGGVDDATNFAFDDKYLYVTEGAPANRVAVVSKSAWKLQGAVGTSDPNPNAIWSDAAAGKLYLTTAGKPEVEVFSAGPTPAFQASYRLSSEGLADGSSSAVGVGAFAPSKGRLFVPVGSYIEELDVQAGALVAGGQSKLPEATASSAGLVYEPATGMLWAVRGTNVAVLDSGSFGFTARLSSSQPADQVAIDPGFHEVYVFGSNGFDAYDTNFTKWNASVKVTGGSGMGAVDPVTHKVFVYRSSDNTLAVWSLAAGSESSPGSSASAGSGSAASDSASASSTPSSGLGARGPIVNSTPAAPDVASSANPGSTGGASSSPTLSSPPSPSSPAIANSPAPSSLPGASRSSGPSSGPAPTAAPLPTAQSAAVPTTAAEPATAPPTTSSASSRPAASPTSSSIVLGISIGNPQPTAASSSPSEAKPASSATPAGGTPAASASSASTPQPAPPSLGLPVVQSTAVPPVSSSSQPSSASPSGSSKPVRLPLG